jgi:hypothetical protein
MFTTRSSARIALATLAAIALSVVPAAAAPFAQKEDKGEKVRADKGDKGDKGQKDKAVDDAYLAKSKEHLGALEREIAELREAGKKEEAEKLMQEARELKAMLEKHSVAKGPKSAAAGDGKDKKPVKTPDKPGVKGEQVDKVQHLRREIEELRAAGKTDQAEKLAAMLREHGAKADKEHAGKDKAGAVLDDKIAYLKKHAAELQEAGRKDEAEKLLNQIERMHDEAALVKKGYKADPGKSDKKPDAASDKSPAAGEIQELSQAIKSLREEVGRLRDEVVELRRQVKGKE